MKAFRILCKYLSLSPSPGVFLYFYSYRLGKRPSWLSLISQSKTCLLSPFTSSYKNFKDDFFKILIEKTEKNYFYGGRPKISILLDVFPFKIQLMVISFNERRRTTCSFGAGSVILETSYSRFTTNIHLT